MTWIGFTDANSSRYNYNETIHNITKPYKGVSFVKRLGWRRTWRTVVLVSIVICMGTAAGCSARPEQEAGTSKGKRVELTISAAASLTDALREIQERYEAANGGVKLLLNIGSSGALQQQIEQGSPADLFLSAAPKNMQALVDKQLIDSTDQISLLRNELVVVVPSDNSIELKELADLTGDAVKTMSIGIPESVPAGSYALAALEHAGLWEELQPKTVQGKDVKQVLQYVETGNADAAFVYRTDAMASTKVTVALKIDPATYPAIEYPFGIIKATKHRAEAEALFNYLQSEEALNIFEAKGFTVQRSER